MITTGAEAFFSIVESEQERGDTVFTNTLFKSFPVTKEPITSRYGLAEHIKLLDTSDVQDKRLRQTSNLD